ncbi:MAG: dephospho-CoA kinase [Hyphomicrobiales bacterium]|nr:dephospho-CoA kinase [Hyphomicrobiales bacterium]
MIVIGITGPIGSGKSTAAKWFATQEGVAVFDADACVHRLYQQDRALIKAIASEFPEAVHDSTVDRKQLGKIIAKNPKVIKVLEKLVHPQVRKEEEAFLESARNTGKTTAILELALLYQTGADALCDVVILVNAPIEVRMDRVLARPGMTQEKLKAIMARQDETVYRTENPNYIIDTDCTVEETQQSLEIVYQKIRQDYA